MNKTALVADRRYEKHFAGKVHPERAERIEAMIDMAEHLERPDVKIYAPREASVEEIALCHHPDYVSAVACTASRPRHRFDPDTHTSPDTYKTAALAAGGVRTAVEIIADGAARKALG